MRQYFHTKSALIVSGIVVAAIWFLQPCKLQAQDPFGEGDPFGGADVDVSDPFGSSGTDAGSGFGDTGFGDADVGTAAPSATASAGQTLGVEDPDPVVRLLYSSPPKTTQQWSDALTWMVRIKRWDETKRLLGNLQAENWSVERQAELSRLTGPSLWLRIRTAEAELTPEQQQLVRDILAAPSKLARDPQAIDNWIQQLSSPEAGVRRLAQLRLQDGSMASVQRIVNRLLSGEAQAPGAILASTVAEFGADGEDALRAACLVKDPQKAARVYLALAEIPSKSFSAELGAAVVGQQLPADAQAKLIEIVLDKYGQVPTASAVHTFLSHKFDEALANYQQKRTSGSHFGSLVWRPTADGQSIQLVEVPAGHRQLERLAQLASHRMQSGVATRDNLVDSGAALLQRAYHLSPTLSMSDISAHLLVPLRTELTVDADYWQQVFHRADELQMHGAALRAVQLMNDHAVRGDFPDPLDFLSQLLGDPRPMMRYSALQAIARLDPKQAFGGSEKAIETAVEMVSLAAGPQALVIGLQDELVQAAGHQLQQQTGAEAIMVNSAKAALKVLSENRPVELVVIADRVSDISLFELMQRLRNTRNGQSLPIAVLTERLYQHERRQIEKMPGVFASVLTADGRQMERVIATLFQSLDTQPMSPDERSEFAVAAGRFLASVSADRDSYAFYPVSDWRDELIDKQHGLSVSGRVSVMSAIGSAHGQTALAEMAANGRLEASERMAAARAFGNSVRRFGMLLPREEIQQTYDLYNQLGPTDPVAAEALGMILDITEAQAGEADWPEGL